MNTQQAHINGFVKRAAQYGLNEQKAIELFKIAEPYKGLTTITGNAPTVKQGPTMDDRIRGWFGLSNPAPPSPVKPVAPKSNP